MRVKICGITNLGDLEATIQAGADFVGFVRDPASMRFVQDALAQELLEAATGRIKTVAVYGTMNDEDPFPFDFVQARDAVGVPPERLWITVDHANGVRECHAVLLDAKSPDGLGGRGELADWREVPKLKALYERVILAGGLSLANVKDAVRQTEPWAVDVSSKVEDAPGKKNHDLIRKFVERAKG